MKHISDVLDAIFDHLDALAGSRAGDSPRYAGMMGVQTGFPDLDAYTTGFQPGDLIVISGAQASGKTSLALGIAYGAAVGHGRKVGLYSLAASADRVIERILSMETGIETERLQRGEICDSEWDRVSRGFGRLSQAPLYIDDVAWNIKDIQAGARELWEAQSLDLLILDPLEQLTGLPSSCLPEGASEISRQLKSLARELRVPVIVLAQSAESGMLRDDPRPLPVDLRDFGSLEEEADVILFIYREEQCENDSEKPGVAEIIVAKHRNGPVGSVYLRFFKRTGRFSDLELYPRPRV